MFKHIRVCCHCRKPIKWHGRHWNHVSPRKNNFRDYTWCNGQVGRLQAEPYIGYAFRLPNNFMRPPKWLIDAFAEIKRIRDGRDK